MKKTEIFNKWIPIEGIPESLYLAELHEKTCNQRCLQITLIDDGEETYDTRRVVITFDGYFAYRSTDEMNRLRIDEEAVIPKYWSLFTIENSEYRQWFNEQSLHITDDSPITHYLFFTSYDIVDVLTRMQPRITCEAIPRIES